ncbi:MAG: hypothetical protein AAF502_07715 [Bacteroidota bacterium]
MKIIDLINCLSKAELGEIRFALKAHSRQSLLKLFDGIVKRRHNINPEKADLFQLVYNEPYAVEKDYLIRNELRLLTQQLEAFVIKDSISAKLRENPSFGSLHLLRRYEKYGALNLYEKEWRKQFRTQKDQKAWDQMADLLYEKARYLRNHKELSVALLKEIAKLTNDAIRYESRHAQEKIRKAELENAFANRSLQAYIPEHQMPEVNYGLFFKPSGEDALLEYLRLRIKSYQASGEKKLAIIHRLIDLYPGVCIFRKEYKNDIYLLWATVGLEHFLAADFEKAQEAYEKTTEVAVTLRLPFDPKIFFNMMSNLMKLKRYEEIVTLVRKRWTDIRNNKTLIYRFEYLLAMSHIFLNEPDAAYKLIHQGINKRPESEYYNFRFLYAICFYLMDDVDRFEREVNNINQKIKYRPPIEREYPVLGQLFAAFTRYKFYLTDKNEQLMLKSDIHKKITEHDKRIPLFKEFLITKWLIGQLT